MAMDFGKANGNGGSQGEAPYGGERWDERGVGSLISLRGVVATLFRQKWKMLFFLLVVMGGAIALVTMTPPVFESEAKLLSRIGRESLALDPSVVGPTVSVAQSRESEINSELAILKSHDLLERVVDKIGPARLLNPPVKFAQGVGSSDVKQPEWLQRLGLSSPTPPRERAIEKLAKNLNLEVDGKSNIIGVSLAAYEPEVARQGLEELLRLYQERHIEVYGNQAPPHFFENQAKKMAASLSEKESELNRFRQERGIASLDKQREYLLSEISNLNNQIADAGSQAGASEAKAEALTKALARYGERIELNRTTGKTNYAADNLKNRLAELRAKEADFVTRYSGDSRMLTNLREQIKTLEGQLSREQETLTEVTTGVDQNRQALLLALETERAQLKAHTARLETLKAALANRAKTLETLSGQEFTLNQLERERKALEADYLSSRENLQRALVTSALDAGKISSISVVQPATLPYRPVKPRKLLMLALALLLGVCGALGLGFLADHLDETVRSSHDVRRMLGAPVLASVTNQAWRECKTAQSRFVRVLSRNN